MKKFLLIGEGCTDEFVYCNASRLAPDIPVPILQVSSLVTNPGMALNVLENLKKLGVAADVITNQNWQSIKKTRYVHLSTNHTFFRVDTEDRVQTLADIPDLLAYEHIIVSDYDKGFLTEGQISTICKNHPSVFVDTKKVLGPWISSARFVKVNNYEYLRSVKQINDVVRDKIIRTLGPNGCEFQGRIYPVEQVSVADTTGAGDAFMASFVFEFDRTQNAIHSLKFANRMASKVVTARGVSTL